MYTDKCVCFKCLLKINSPSKTNGIHGRSLEKQTYIIIELVDIDTYYHNVYKIIFMYRIYLFLIWNIPLLYFNLLISTQYLHVNMVKLEVRILYLLHMKLNSQNVLDMFDLTWPMYKSGIM